VPGWQSSASTTASTPGQLFEILPDILKTTKAQALSGGGSFNASNQKIRIAPTKVIEFELLVKQLIYRNSSPTRLFGPRQLLDPVVQQLTQPLQYFDTCIPEVLRHTFGHIQRLLHHA
jgi:hypothetical protein